MASDEVTVAADDVDTDAEAHTAEDVVICQECGASETGFFCRQCGALLQGEDLVLCPRCHRVVPDGDYCNQCGQTLAGIALNLHQLALAGHDFMVVTATSSPAVAAVSDAHYAPDDVVFGVPDESLDLEDAVVPDWLTELPKAKAPREVRERIYPSLRPVEDGERSSTDSRFLTVVVVLLALTLLGLVGFMVLLATQVL